MAAPAAVYAHRRDIDRYYADSYPMWNYHRGRNNRWWVAGPSADYLRDHRVKVDRARTDLSSLDMNRIGRLGMRKVACQAERHHRPLIGRQ